MEKIIRKKEHEFVIYFKLRIEGFFHFYFNNTTESQK